MKKKLLWIAALLAALALLVTGCPTGGGDDDDDDDNSEDKAAANVYYAREAGGAFTKIQDADQPLTLTENYVRIIFDAPGKDFQKIRVKFSLSEATDVMQQCAYEKDGEGGGTWGSAGDRMYLDMASEFTYEKDPAVEFIDKWGSGQLGNTLDKAHMIGICFAIPTGAEYSIKFTLNELTFVGIGKSSEPSVPSGTIDVDFKNGVKKTATLVSSNSAKIENGKIIVTWNPSDEGGAFRVKVQLAADSQVDLSTGYSKFKMDWTSGSANGGNFNISLYFPGNRMLSAYGASGTATFDFTSDHPSWAAGTDWGGAAVGTITGFEIYSGDSDNFGNGTLVITKLSFE